ncbi:Flp pilus assembly protein CpaB [Piscinibacter sp. XHJ-5]|uniref:Flp pilus assembly protein CpaB n=1 Tax=Piscinibacter sp. XHJ-5 TaxID=3037797 RepID=UPI002453153C|nr:Flp pilus assembly protein CpaB [Piscinibacter sp. XHJ-5]
MKSRGLLMLLIAVAAGLAAMLMAARWMQEQGGDRGRIAVAAAEVELGSRLTADMVRLVEWPQSSMPPGAFTDLAKLEGRVVTSSVHRGEPILDSRLAPEGTKGGLSAVVPEGKRAMTVRVNDVVGVAGFALPGTFVDIMVNTQEEGGQRSDRDRTVSKIVLERILVLAIAQEADRDNTKPKVVSAVTLELTPGQAEVLDLARSVGTLSLVLRNQTESKMADTSGATKAQLLGLKPVAAAASAAPAPRPVVARRVAPRTEAAAAEPVIQRQLTCVEVIRGMNRVTECF